MYKIAVLFNATVLQCYKCKSLKINCQVEGPISSYVNLILV